MFISFLLYASPPFQLPLNFLLREIRVVGSLISSSQFHIQTLASIFGYVSSFFFFFLILFWSQVAEWIVKRENSKSVSFSAVPRAGLGQNKPLPCQQQLLTVEHQAAQHCSFPVRTISHCLVRDSLLWDSVSSCTSSHVRLESQTNEQKRKQREGKQSALDPKSLCPERNLLRSKAFPSPPSFLLRSKGFRNWLQKVVVYGVPSLHHLCSRSEVGCQNQVPVKEFKEQTAAASRVSGMPAGTKPDWAEKSQSEICHPSQSLHRKMQLFLPSGKKLNLKAQAMLWSLSLQLFDHVNIDLKNLISFSHKFHNNHGKNFPRSCFQSSTQVGEFAPALFTPFLHKHLSHKFWSLSCLYRVNFRCLLAKGCTGNAWAFDQPANANNTMTIAVWVIVK